MNVRWLYQDRVILVTLPEVLTIAEMGQLNGTTLAHLNKSPTPKTLVYNCTQLKELPPDIITYLRYLNDSSPLNSPRVDRVLVAAYSRMVDVTSSVAFTLYPRFRDMITFTDTFEEALTLVNDSMRKSGP